MDHASVAAGARPLDINWLSIGVAANTSTGHHSTGTTGGGVDHTILTRVDKPEVEDKEGGPPKPGACCTALVSGLSIGKLLPSCPFVMLEFASPVARSVKDTSSYCCDPYSTGFQLIPAPGELAIVGTEALLSSAVDVTSFTSGLGPLDVGPTWLEHGDPIVGWPGLEICFFQQTCWDVDPMHPLQRHVMPIDDNYDSSSLLRDVLHESLDDAGLSEVLETFRVAWNICSLEEQSTCLCRPPKQENWEPQVQTGLSRNFSGDSNFHKVADDSREAADLWCTELPLRRNKEESDIGANPLYSLIARAAPGKEKEEGEGEVWWKL